MAHVEEIFLPDQAEACRLPETSPALKVLQRVRDESHRFATNFNKRLRQKDVRLTNLTSLPRIGEIRSKKLMQRFGSVANIAAAPPETLADVLRIGLKNAEELKEQLQELVP